jgi:hypothetical protein
MRLVEPEFDLGNILRDGAEAVALNSASFALSMPPGCAPGSCRLAALNSLLQNGGGQNAAAEIRENPFF